MLQETVFYPCLLVAALFLPNKTTSAHRTAAASWARSMAATKVATHRSDVQISGSSCSSLLFCAEETAISTSLARHTRAVR